MVEKLTGEDILQQRIEQLMGDMLPGFILRMLKIDRKRIAKRIVNMAKEYVENKNG